MSIHSQDSPIAAVPGYNATALRRRDLRPSSPSRPAIFVNDSNTEDWFQQKFHEQGPKDANLRAFLVDYAQCKNSRLEGLFQSMVACNYFEPPSTTQYWAPRNVLSNGQGLEGPDTSKSPTFSQALNQFRLFLRQGDPGCARFWSEYHSARITHQLTQNLEVSSPPATMIASNRELLASKKAFLQRLSSLNESTRLQC